MLVFYPKKGFKSLLPIYGILSLLLIPTFFILISIQASYIVWLSLIFFGYGLISLMYLLAQQTTQYWIENNNLYYKSLFMRGIIDIYSIRKLELNSSNWSSNKPATTFTKGITIFYNKIDDIYFSPEDNCAFVNALRQINPSIEIVKIK